MWLPLSVFVEATSVLLVADTEADSCPNHPSVCHTDELHQGQTAVSGSSIFVSMTEGEAITGLLLIGLRPPNLAYFASVAGYLGITPAITTAYVLIVDCV